jgi:WD repeat-containing protein mio
MPSATTSPASSHRTLLDVPSSGSHSSASFTFPASSSSSSDPSSSHTYKRRSRISRRSRSPADSVHGDFHDAVVSVLARKGIIMGGSKEKANSGWRPSVMTNKLHQRRLALELCAWDLGNEVVQTSAKRWLIITVSLAIVSDCLDARWSETGQISRAACWFVLIGQHDKAVEVLMKSNGKVINSKCLFMNY